MSDQKNDSKTRQHHFDQLMFGKRNLDSKLTEPSQKKAKDVNTPTSSEGDFDLLQMMLSVDELMSNVKQIKPMFQQLASLVDLFKQKK